MSEEKKSIPKPTIKTTPPIKPPATSVDTVVEEPKVPEIKKEEPPVPASADVEVDLVKRFLGTFIDGIVALAVGYIVLLVSGSELIKWISFGLVMLTRDSLPILNGQSLGKKVMKTKAVKADGSSLSGDWLTGATRNILLANPVVGIIECFILLTRSGNPEAGLRLGDNWARTKVIPVD